MKNIKGFVSECLLFQTDLKEFKILGLSTWILIAAILLVASVS